MRIGRGQFALIFVIVSLVAVVILPTFWGRGVARVQGEIDQELLPARELAIELQTLQAEESAALQGYLLTGQARFHTRYQAARERERVVYDELLQRTSGIDLLIRERVAVHLSLASSWHLNQDEAIGGRLQRQNYLDNLLSVQQDTYERLSAASLALQASIDEEVAQGRSRVDRARALQRGITLALVILALQAMVGVVWLGRNLRDSLRESERRRADSLRARREVDAVLEATGDGVMGLDLEGRCVFLNHAGAKLLGVGRRAAQGEHVGVLLSPAAQEGSDGIDSVLSAIREGRGFEGDDVQIRRRDGTHLPVYCSVQRMVDGREVTGSVLTFADMSEIRAAEGALRQAVHARDEVLAVVSHDLRNPVGTVFSAADLLLDVPLPEEKVREHLGIIRRSAERMTRLIQDLLDVARIEEGGFSVQCAAEDVHSILSEALELARPRASAKGVDLEIESGRAPRVWVDRGRILQILSNLLGNAIRFSPVGAAVTVSAHAGEEEITVCVRDRGPGISGEQMEHIFDRFWQAGGRGGGAGLGLSIVRGITEAHGGRVWAESGGEGGSTFFFTLPHAPEE